MYQSTHTGAQVDEAVDKALSADSVPTPNSTNLVQSGGVFGVVSNRNLLDNGWFTVNQRGVADATTITGNGYVADRWQATGNGAQRVAGGGITILGTVYHKLDNPGIAGKTVTLSILYSDGEISSNTFTWAGTQFSKTFKYGTAQIYPSANHINIAAQSVNVTAAKLEIGEVSTLANDVPPSYGEEFERCATSRADSNDAYANQAPVSMRGFVPLFYTGTMPANGGEVNQPTFAGYNEYYLVDFQYVNVNGYAYGLSDSAFSASPYIQYAKNTPTTACRIRFTITSNSAWNGRPYYVLLMAR